MQFFVLQSITDHYLYQPLRDAKPKVAITAENRYPKQSTVEEDPVFKEQFEQRPRRALQHLFYHACQVLQSKCQATLGAGHFDVLVAVKRRSLFTKWILSKIGRIYLTIPE